MVQEERAHQQEHVDAEVGRRAEKLPLHAHNVAVEALDGAAGEREDAALQVLELPAAVVHRHAALRAQRVPDVRWDLVEAAVLVCPSLEDDRPRPRFEEPHGAGERRNQPLAGAAQAVALRRERPPERGVLLRALDQVAVVPLETPPEHPIHEHLRRQQSAALGLVDGLRCAARRFLQPVERLAQADRPHPLRRRRLRVDVEPVIHAHRQRFDRVPDEVRHLPQPIPRVHRDDVPQVARHHLGDEARRERKHQAAVHHAELFPPLPRRALQIGRGVLHKGVGEARLNEEVPDLPRVVVAHRLKVPRLLLPPEGVVSNKLEPPVDHLVRALPRHGRPGERLLIPVHRLAAHLVRVRRAQHRFGLEHRGPERRHQRPGRSRLPEHLPRHAVVRVVGHLERCVELVGPHLVHELGRVHPRLERFLACLRKAGVDHIHRIEKRLALLLGDAGKHVVVEIARLIRRDAGDVQELRAVPAVDALVDQQLVQLVIRMQPYLIEHAGDRIEVLPEERPRREPRHFPDVVVRVLLRGRVETVGLHADLRRQIYEVVEDGLDHLGFQRLDRAPPRLLHELDPLPLLAQRVDPPLHALLRPVLHGPADVLDARRPGPGKPLAHRLVRVVDLRRPLGQFLEQHPVERGRGRFEGARVHQQSGDRVGEQLAR